MATKNTLNPQAEINQLKVKLSQLRLDIRAGKNTNTNAHKTIKKQIAQLLTKI